jgi:prepilin-type N-terminal cleavage/methylation domain-containing protein
MTHDQNGVTLLELLISMAILGMIVVGLHQVMSTATSTYDDTRSKQELLAEARYAMGRMVMFAKETDAIQAPEDVGDGEVLIVSDRVLDTHNNTSHAYDEDGDGLLDADNDGDGLVNEGGADPSDWITFDVDKSIAANWRLREEMPDYSTAALADAMSKEVLCEHVTAFHCNRLARNLVEITLTLGHGKSEVSLTSRVKARLIN